MAYNYSTRCVYSGTTALTILKKRILYCLATKANNQQLVKRPQIFYPCYFSRLPLSAVSVTLWAGLLPAFIVAKVNPNV